LPKPVYSWRTLRRSPDLVEPYRVLLLLAKVLHDTASCADCYLAMIFELVKAWKRTVGNASVTHFVARELSAMFPPVLEGGGCSGQRCYGREQRPIWRSRVVREECSGLILGVSQSGISKILCYGRARTPRASAGAGWSYSRHSPWGSCDPYDGGSAGDRSPAPVFNLRPGVSCPSDPHM